MISFPLPFLLLKNAEAFTKASWSFVRLFPLAPKSFIDLVMYCWALQVNDCASMNNKMKSSFMILTSPQPSPKEREEYPLQKEF